MPRGYELRVNFLGKAATWSLRGARVRHGPTERGTDWPLWDLLGGLRLAVAAGVRPQGRREEVRHEGRRHGRRRGHALRPLTSNQPKPMVPIVGKPCMEHIIELLSARVRGRHRHRRLPAAGDPWLLRGRARPRRSDPVLGRGVAARHRRVGPARRATSSRRHLPRHLRRRALRLRPHEARRVPPRARRGGDDRAQVGDNPLEFGIVVTDDDGRIERFLEKPSWGQVFSDTINTGVYVLEPEVLRTSRPTARTTSRRSSSRCCSRWAGRSTATRWTATGRTSATSISTGRRTSTRSTRACS